MGWDLTQISFFLILKTEPVNLVLLKSRISSIPEGVSNLRLLLWPLQMLWLVADSTTLILCLGVPLLMILIVINTTKYTDITPVRKTLPWPPIEHQSVVKTDFLMQVATKPGGHGVKVVTLSPPTSEAGVRFLARPQAGKLVVACCWLAVYSTEP